MENEFHENGSEPLDASPVSGGKGPERLLTVAEVAAWFGVTECWVRSHAAGRRPPKLPSVRINRSILRFRERDLDAWLREKGLAA
jgi:predicted DNA-binding transcriptional regulator AlpA